MVTALYVAIQGGNMLNDDPFTAVYGGYLIKYRRHSGVPWKEYGRVASHNKDEVVAKLNKRRSVNEVICVKLEGSW
jgi:hypothetical protein